MDFYGAASTRERAVTRAGPPASARASIGNGLKSLRSRGFRWTNSTPSDSLRGVGPSQRFSGADSAQLQCLFQDNYRLQKDLGQIQRKLAASWELSRSMDDLVQRFALRVMALEEQVRGLGAEPVVPPEAATDLAILGPAIPSIPLTDSRMNRVLKRPSSLSLPWGGQPAEGRSPSRLFKNSFLRGQ
jgi:hypothetical protein